MNIKEVEKQTGITKANIRFYESEGLITPERSDNGYRTYDQTHVELLKKIRLFRSLGISIEMLKELSEGTVSLPEVLKLRQVDFAHQYDQLELTAAVVKHMLEKQASFDSVNVEDYIRMLNQGEVDGLNQDVDPKINLPWRRFWARMLDLSLCNFILYLLIPGIFGNHVWVVVRFGLNLLLFVVAEVFWLAFVGATPGKAVFGISVTDLEGKRLTPRSALDRTEQLLQKGLGWNIPFLSQYLQWQSLKALDEGKELSWECDSEVNFRDKSNWRYILFTILMIPILLYPLVDGYAHEFLPHVQEDLPNQTTEMIVESERDFYAMRNSYRVAEVLYSIDNQYAVEALPLVLLDNCTMRFSYKSSNQYEKSGGRVAEIGIFERLQLESADGISCWELMSESDPAEKYQFHVREDDTVVLDYFENEEMQWSWRLVEVENLNVKLISEHSKKSLSPYWWFEGAFEKQYVESMSTHLRYPISMELRFPEGENQTVITIREEFYVGEAVAVRELTVVADEAGVFSISIPLPELEKECCSVFFIPYANGDYIVCFTYEPGKEAWDSFIYDL